MHQGETGEEDLFVIAMSLAFARLLSTVIQVSVYKFHVFTFFRENLSHFGLDLFFSVMPIDRVQSQNPRR